MKFGFTLKDIKIGEQATIGEVSINGQFDVKEFADGYDLVRKVVKEIPAIVADMESGVRAFVDADSELGGIFNKRTEDESAVNNNVEVNQAV